MSDSPNYNAMSKAITEMLEHGFDDIEQIDDVDEQLRVLAKIANNFEPEKRCIKIRRRAEWHAFRGMAQIRRAAALRRASYE